MEEYYGEEAEEEVKQPPPRRVATKDRSTALLARVHDSSRGVPECSYCKGKRLTYTGEEETGLEYHKLGFTSTKMRYDDYETLLNEGFTRCGSYFYMRNIQRSCCEAYQYRVALDEFVPSKS